MVSLKYEYFVFTLYLPQVISFKISDKNPGSPFTLCALLILQTVTSETEQPPCIKL